MLQGWFLRCWGTLPRENGSREQSSSPLPESARTVGRAVYTSDAMIQRFRRHKKLETGENVPKTPLIGCINSMPFSPSLTANEREIKIPFVVPACSLSLWHAGFTLSVVNQQLWHAFLAAWAMPATFQMQFPTLLPSVCTDVAQFTSVQIRTRECRVNSACKFCRPWWEWSQRKSPCKGGFVEIVVSGWASTDVFGTLFILRWKSLRWPDVVAPAYCGFCGFCLSQSWRWNMHFPAPLLSSWQSRETQKWV